MRRLRPRLLRTSSFGGGGGSRGGGAPLLPADSPPVLAAARLVAVQGSPAVPLVQRVLGLHAELTGRQPRLEAADVVEGGVQSGEVVATCRVKGRIAEFWSV